MFIQTGWTDPIPLFLWKVHTLFWLIAWFSVTIPRCYKYDYGKSFFSRIAKLSNSLPAECFTLTFALNGFKFRVNGHLLVPSKQVSFILLIFFFSCSTMQCSGCSLLHGLHLNLKKYVDQLMKVISLKGHLSAIHSMSVV